MHAPRDLPDPTLEPAGDDAVGYVPVSGLAVAALVLGGLSALVVVSPLFLVVPLVAIAVAAAAIRDVSRRGDRKAGRLAAIAGLALAAGFSSQAIVAGITARSIAVARAAGAAELFLAAVRDDRLADAEAMCGPDARGQVAALAACPRLGRRQSPQPGDQPGTWIVSIPSPEPGGCEVKLVLEPAVVVQQRKRVERWLVTACEVTGAASAGP